MRARAAVRGCVMLVMLGCAFLLAACSGSTGAPGATGPAGATGPSGPPGTTGIAALDISTASSITATITSVTVPAAAPIQPVVNFQLVNQEGEPLKGLTAAELGFAIAKLVPAGTQLQPVPPQTTAPTPLQGSQWQSYIYVSAPVSTTSNPTYPVVGTGPQPQASVEAAASGKLVDNGDGTYQYTFKTDLSSVAGVSYDPTLTHRLGFEIRGVTDSSGNTIAANSPVYTFQPSTGATTGIAARDIVDDTDCKNCHQVLAWHGGARTEVQYCVVCHNPSSFDPSSGNTIDFKVMFHKIHMGSSLPSFTGPATPVSLGVAPATSTPYYIYGYGGAVSDYEKVVFPRGDASDNNTTVSGDGTRLCTTCHNTSDAATPQAGNYASIPSSAACGSCHDNVNFTTGVGHSGANLPATDDQCVTCHGPASTIDNGAIQVVNAHTTGVDSAIQKFQYQIESVTSTGPGQTPVATILVTDPTNGNAPYDITDPAGPFQNSGSALNLDLAWNTTDINNIGSGSAPSASSGTPNQPITINFKAGAATATKNADGSFTLAAATPIPTTASGTGIASLEGRAVVALANIGTTGTTATELGVQGVSTSFLISGTVTPRTAIVDIAKCDVCHNTLTLHGQNRTNDIQLCVSCHNPNATDAVQHTSTVAGSPCAPGTPDNPIDFKVLIHEIHASGDSYAYGTSGVTICSFGGSPSVFQVLYPGDSNASLANCAACHNSGTYYPVDGTVIQGTTIHAGDRTTLTDDVVISPNAAVCSSCHTDTDAKNHMIQNGANFAATKTASGALNPAWTETCSVCHSSGAIADVAVVHQLSRFQ